MSIKVKEVLELAQSKGCTLAAGEGGIDRIVRFVDCMEIPDMKAWMRPNVLYITTGYAYSDTKEEIMNLIRNLYEAKAAALATKYRYIGCFLDDAIKLANELQFPIILWPEDLPFIEINYLVMEALIKSQNNLMDSIYSRIEKYNRREMDKRLFIDLLTGNITCNEEGNYRIEEQKWPSPPYQIVYIEIDEIKQKLHELQEEIVHEKIEKIENMIKESFGEEKVIVLSNNDNFQCILKRTKEKTITKEYFEKIQKNISEKTGYTAAIGVSRVENSYQRFGKAYQDARDMVTLSIVSDLQHYDSQLTEVDKMLEQMYKMLGCTLTTIPGVNVITAVKILAEIGDIKRFSNANKLAQFAGIAPLHLSSSGKGKDEATKQGNRRLQATIYFLAIQMVQVSSKGTPRNSVVRAYYEKRKAEGKTSQQALICISRRLISIIYGMLKHGTEYRMPVVESAGENR